MNTLSERDLNLHVTIVAWLLIIENAICLLIGLVGFLFMTGIGFATQDQTAALIMSVIGTAGVIFFGMLSVPGLVAGFGLLSRKPWARILALVIAALGLFNFPIGTVLGLYKGWVLLQASADQYFTPAHAVA